MNERPYEEVLETNGFFCWKIVGVSMLPLLREGKDIIVIRKRPPERLKKYDVVLFKRAEMGGKIEYVLHRIMRVNSDGTYWIVGDNCIGGDIAGEDSIIGILSAIVRNGRNIDGDNLLYKIYIRLWCAPYPLRFFVLRCKSYIKIVENKIFGVRHRP